LCHVPNIYNEEDVNSIIHRLDSKHLGYHPVHLPLLSPHSGLPFPADDFGSLLELICTEALTKPLFLDNLITGILNNLSSPGMPECQVLTFRTSIISNSLLSSIESGLPTVTVIKHDLIDWADKEHGGTSHSVKHSKLAVVGLSCRLPGGANDPELFWKLMVDGRDVHTEVPADRFDLETHYDPSGKTENATETPFGNFIENPGLFDPAFFNMSPREVSTPYWFYFTSHWETLILTLYIAG
jgi:asperthecin polyketide synthase